MKQLLSGINIKVNQNIYLKNPDSSELGKKIIAGSIDLINEVGFEAFTFKKLGQAIGSTEASIYRYFESKHKLLLYLNCWYWSWTEYKMMFWLANIPSPEERLRKAILLLTQEVGEENSFIHINELKLNQIVISESSKTYLTKDVDQDNKLGAYAVQKQLVQRVSDIILEINPNYKYPHMLISTVIEGVHLQRYFAEHLPKLTDTSDKDDYITAFYTELVFKAIEK
ncbi:MAG: TetR family transcriptional regulator [Bacteroidetes bacterium HGW-Bacteroidetes-12]|nr:MAG: TetR family transcriptional regulator [Bacteroidetes bacterium HGW-Bacteroidetes-12]